LRTLLDHLPGMTYRAAADWSSDILLNCEALTGYTAAEINASAGEMAEPDPPGRCRAVVVDCERLRSGPQQATLSYRIIDRNGNSRWIEDRKISLFAGDGSFLGVEGIAVDSAAATARERGRGFSDPHYRSLIEAAFDGYWLTDSRGRLLDVNDAYCRLSGYTRDELLHLSIDQIEAQSDTEDVAAQLVRVRHRGSDRFETRHRRKDGTSWPVKVSTCYSPEAGGQWVAFLRDLRLPVQIDGQAVAVTGVGNKATDHTAEDREGVPQLAELAIELTARKQAEASLRASESRFRRLFESMTSGFALHEIVLDAEGKPCDYRFIDVNPAFEAITGLARADTVGRCVRELLPNIEPHWIERYGAVALTGDGQQFDDFSSDLDRQYRVTVYRPEPQQFAVIVDDITALRRHEESLRQAATVFEQTRDGVAITDASARIIAVNRAFSKITGYSSEEVVGRNTSLLKSGHHDAAFYAAMWSQLTGKGFWEGEVCNRRKNGEHYPQWLTISAVLNER
jgi:PAS domain S-box-containing protein